ncbi:MAG: ABC transporter substrate-binding protein [Pseudomonadota bacterium]
MIDRCFRARRSLTGLAWLLMSLWCLGGCRPDEPPATSSANASPSRPTRIVSLDYCADQYVVAIADRQDILRVSPDATAPYSWVSDRARDLASVRPRPEDVLILQPDLVVRSYGGGPNAHAFLSAAGVPVVQVPYVSDLAGARRSVISMAEALGVPQRGLALARDMDQRLAAIEPLAEPPAALYVASSGVSAGPGTLIDELLQAAGLDNFQRDPGWHSLPLERLVYERPDVLVLAYFDSASRRKDAWTPATHPVMRRQLAELPNVALEAGWVSCGGWFMVEAVEALADAARHYARVVQP